MLFVVFAFVAVLLTTCFTLSAEMRVDVVVFKFAERVYSFEFLLFHIEERRNIYLKYSTDRSLSFADGSGRIPPYVAYDLSLGRSEMHSGILVPCGRPLQSVGSVECL